MEPQKEAKRVPLLPIARAWRRTTSAAIPQSWPARVLQSPAGALIAARPHSSPAQGRLGSRFARTLRKRALKNPRADGLAPARGQHSTIGRFAISIVCCGFLVVRRGGFHIRPGIWRQRKTTRLVFLFMVVRREGSRPPTGVNANPVRGVGDAAPYIHILKKQPA